MTTFGPPAGWYTDPTSGNGLRWWDGSAWTADFHAWGAPTLRDERGPARAARVALLLAGPAQFGSGVLMVSVLRNIVDEFRTALDTGADAAPTLYGDWLEVLGQTLSAVGAVTAVLFLVWFARSAANARDLGIPARREPAAGVAGFLVPIINLWWPYQSVSDLFADSDRARPMVLRWFLLWVVGGFVGGGLAIAAAFVDSWVGWLLLGLSGVPPVLASLAARQVVAAAVHEHEALAGAKR